MSPSELVSGPIVPATGHNRAVVRLCWFQIAVAVVLYLIALVVDLSGPAVGMRWRAGDGRITEVLAGGPAAIAGVKPGDSLISLNLVPRQSSRPPLYDSLPGETLDAVIARDGAPVAIRITPVTRIEERATAVAAGGPYRVRTFGEMLRLIVSTFVLGLAVLILYLRPQLPAARVAALSLAYWVGGNELTGMQGFGRFFPSLTTGMRFGIVLLDLLYLSAFFALMIHFAMIFPDPLPPVRRNRWWQLAPYVAASPLFLAAILSTTRFFYPSTRGTVPNLDFATVFSIYGPAMLLAETAVLAAQFRYVADRNDRRRLVLVLISSIPGLATWVIAIVSQTVGAQPAALASTMLLQWIGAATGYAVFSYALIRHRIFGARPLLRKSIQYALARGTLIVALALPAVSLILFLYTKRHESLARLVTQDFMAPLMMIIIAVVLFRYRNALIDMIDRRFFREDYDARRALLRVVSMIQRGTDLTVLGRVALLEIEKSLHPLHLSLWVVDTSDMNFQSIISQGQERLFTPLSRQSGLIRLIEARREPIEIDRPFTIQLRRLPLEELAWLEVTGAALIVPLSVDHDIMGFLLLGERLSEEPYSADDRDLLMAIAGQLALTEDYGRLEILARKDPLTEALNRHAFYSLLDKKRSFPFQQGTSGSVAVVDVNDLKRINDTQGHAAGDMAIRRTASAIRAVVRADDLVFRWGGDEFLVVLFGLTSPEVQRRLDSLDTLRFDYESSVLEISVSYGIASFDEVNFVPAAIDEADRAMYAYKLAQKKSRA